MGHCKDGLLAFRPGFRDIAVSKIYRDAAVAGSLRARAKLSIAR
jgi:hypothetical protein